VKRHAGYKDSGQSWVGEIPSHWELKPNRSLFWDVGKTVENEGEGFLLLSLTQNGLIPRDMENPSGKFPSDFSTYQKVAKGDLVFCLFDVDETPRTVGIASHDGMITGAYTVMRCYDDSYAKYLYWFYLSLDEAKRLKPLYRGLRKVVPAETFRSIKSPIPPRDEASKICNYIESQVDSMNKAIASQGRMIELLKERRSSIITQAVTKGLDPKAKMKDSGVPWLPEVNAEWAYSPLKSLVCIPIQNGLGESSSRSDPNDPRYIRITDIDSNGRLRVDTFSSVPREDCVGSYVAHKDLLFAAVGGTVGKSYLHLEKDGDYCYAGYLVRVRPDVCKIEPAFLKFWAESRCFWSQVEANLVKVTIENFSASRYSRLFVPLPSLEKQQEIVRFLKKICEDLDSAITSQECLIELLKERRSAIITQAVTGQIDVR